MRPLSPSRCCLPLRRCIHFFFLSHKTYMYTLNRTFLLLLVALIPFPFLPSSTQTGRIAFGVVLLRGNKRLSKGNCLCCFVHGKWRMLGERNPTFPFSSRLTSFRARFLCWGACLPFKVVLLGITCYCLLIVSSRSRLFGTTNLQNNPPFLTQSSVSAFSFLWHRTPIIYFGRISCCCCYPPSL